MSLKFTFGGSSPDHHDHGHDGETPGIPLPFDVTAKAPVAGTSSVLELQVRQTATAVECTAVSGDGVTYARAEKALAAADTGAADGSATDASPAASVEAVAAAVRSAIARAGAELPEPLIDAVTAVVVDLDGGADVLRALGLEVGEQADPPTQTSEALRARTGIAAGTPVRLAST